MTIPRKATSLYRPTRAEIKLANIEKNIQLFRESMSSAPLIMAVVKANGYGHGDEAVARASLRAGASRLGVALLEEAAALREEGIDAPIHLLFEPPPSSAREVVRWELIPSVYREEYALALSREAKAARRRLKVHIKVDTGMRRVGVAPDEVGKMARLIDRLPYLEVEGIYTHFALASDPSSPFTRKQLEILLRTIERLEGEGWEFPLKHAAASGAALCLPEAELDMVRLGIGIYGLYPGQGFAEMVTLHPALELKTELAYVFRARRGEGISYGFTHRLERDSYIGVIPIGYGDGLTRHLSNRMEVLIRGKRYRQVGTICMDLAMVELGDDCYEPGEEVVLVGRSGNDRITVEEMAEWAGTINYEVVCALGKRIPRIYI